MSINGVYAAVNKHELDALVASPNKWQSFWQDRRQAMFRACIAEKNKGTVPSPILLPNRHRDEGYSTAPKTAPGGGALPLAEPSISHITGARFLDLDQYYEELHVLLTGEEVPSEEPIVTGNPFTLAIAGGQSIEQTNTGYGPVRVLQPDQVISIAESVSKLRYDKLCNEHDVEGCPEEYFDAFKTFFTEASSKKEFVLAAFI